MKQARYTKTCLAHVLQSRGKKRKKSWRSGDLNPRPFTCKANALPTELHPLHIRYGSVCPNDPSSQSQHLLSYFKTSPVMSDSNQLNSGVAPLKRLIKLHLSLDLLPCLLRPQSCLCLSLAFELLKKCSQGAPLLFAPQRAAAFCCVRQKLLACLHHASKRANDKIVR